MADSSPLKRLEGIWRSQALNLFDPIAVRIPRRTMQYQSRRGGLSPSDGRWRHGWLAALPIALAGCLGEIGSPDKPGGAYGSAAGDDGNTDGPGATPGPSGGVVPGGASSDGGSPAGGSPGGGLPAGGNPGGSVGATGVSPFVCDPSALVPEQPLRRLSSPQYQNSIRDLVASLAPADSTAIMNEIAGKLAALPRDLRSGPDADYGGLRRLDQSIYGEMVDGSYEVGIALGSALTASPNRLRVVADACATDTNTGNDAACVDNFIRKLVERAFRRPASNDDVAFYRGAVQGNPVVAADYADIVTQIVSAPFFLYSVELGADGVAPAQSVPLSAYELASRLAFHFWQTAPDAELSRAAADKTLLDDAVYAKQVDRLYASAKTSASLEEFFVDWLQPKHLEELNAHVGSPDFDALRGSFLPSATLKAQMISELGRMGRYYTHDVEATFADFFRSNLSFASTEELATLYGVTPWTSGAPPRMPQLQREGVLTRAALVATGNASSHPIFKGVYARKVVLCDNIPPPPADAMTVANKVKPDGITSRALTDALSKARGDCAGCHATFINPIGYALESFDGLGRFRELERVFDPKTGALLGEVPVDSSSVPRIVSGDTREVAGPQELNQAMLDSTRPQACFARRYFRFMFAREEDPARDGCVLSAIYDRLLAGESMGAVLRGLALRPEFRTKSYQP